MTTPTTEECIAWLDEQISVAGMVDLCHLDTRRLSIIKAIRAKLEAKTEAKPILRSDVLDNNYQSGRGIVCAEKSDDDLLAAINYWGSSDYQHGCELAHYILLNYINRIQDAVASRG